MYQVKKHYLKAEDHNKESLQGLFANPDVATGYQEIPLSESYSAREGNEPKIRPPKGSRCKTDRVNHLLTEGTEVYDLGGGTNKRYVCPNHIDQIPLLTTFLPNLEARLKSKSYIISFEINVT